MLSPLLVSFALALLCLSRGQQTVWHQSYEGQFFTGASFVRSSSSSVSWMLSMGYWQGWPAVPTSMFLASGALHSFVPVWNVSTLPSNSSGGAAPGRRLSSSARQKVRSLPPGTVWPQSALSVSALFVGLDFDTLKDSAAVFGSRSSLPLWQQQSSGRAESFCESQAAGAVSASVDGLFAWGYNPEPQGTSNMSTAVGVQFPGRGPYVKVHLRNSTCFQGLALTPGSAPSLVVNSAIKNADGTINRSVLSIFRLNLAARSVTKAAEHENFYTWSTCVSSNYIVLLTTDSINRILVYSVETAQLLVNTSYPVHLFPSNTSFSFGAFCKIFQSRLYVTFALFEGGVALPSNLITMYSLPSRPFSGDMVPLWTYLTPPVAPTLQDSPVANFLSSDGKYYVVATWGGVYANGKQAPTLRVFDTTSQMRFSKPLSYVTRGSVDAMDGAFNQQGRLMIVLGCLGAHSNVGSTTSDAYMVMI